MEKITFEPVKNEIQIKELAQLAKPIWEQHFTPIIGKAQVEYMVSMFQSVPALTKQINEGYEYYRFFVENQPIGYTGIHEEEGKLFLSKLYIKKEYRGKHFSSKALDFLTALAKERKLSAILLTVNKHNDNTISIYKHMGFVVTKEQKADIGNGFFMDDYIMELSIGVK